MEARRPGMTKLDGDAKDAHYSFPIFFQRDVTSQRSGIFFLGFSHLDKSLT